MPGPTQDLINSVPGLSNRSQAQIDVTLAIRSGTLAEPVMLLLGPILPTPSDSRRIVHGFRLAQDLCWLLAWTLPRHDAPAIAAAASDARPRHLTELTHELRRTLAGARE